ncbi:hypothetical protein GCM10010145_43320 [Streptomyces ruber]|uniref:HTH tetR-type domain-containing protein n=2 Tax=Streptomyces TaxID=1883 RepID=A0A918BJT9_9ACTN|nr:hypothetical protein GCM10010145_43320 [Streptomyces ruber]
MTNKRTADRLEPGTVIRAALERLDEKGLEALSPRAVAARLGVRMNTVLWHVKTKARMLELMADAVLGEVPLDDLPSAPAERARELARRVRRALLPTATAPHSSSAPTSPNPTPRASRRRSSPRSWRPG